MRRGKGRGSELKRFRFLLGYIFSEYFFAFGFASEKKRGFEDGGLKLSTGMFGGFEDDGDEENESEFLFIIIILEY